MRILLWLASGKDRYLPDSQRANVFVKRENSTPFGLGELSANGQESFRLPNGVDFDGRVVKCDRENLEFNERHKAGVCEPFTEALGVFEDCCVRASQFPYPRLWPSVCCVPKKTTEGEQMPFRDLWGAESAARADASSLVGRC